MRQQSLLEQFFKRSPTRLASGNQVVGLKDLQNLKSSPAAYDVTLICMTWTTMFPSDGHHDYAPSSSPLLKAPEPRWNASTTLLEIKTEEMGA